MSSSNPQYSVLFVCTVNMVRSPIAAALFSRILEADGVRGDWRVESAGTWARPGKKSPPGLVDVMAEQGIDLSEHRSRIVSAEMLREFNLILVMEPGHKEALKVEFPEVSSRVYLLSEMSGKPTMVGDPAGGTQEEYLRTAAELKNLLVKGKDRIQILAGKA